MSEQHPIVAARMHRLRDGTVYAIKCELRYSTPDSLAMGLAKVREGKTAFVRQEDAPRILESLATSANNCA